ncbi:MAG: PqqD family protein [Elusimicrobiota bacterium]|nr:PqqD family protein [Elusimicrobiota bacterium]
MPKATRYRHAAHASWRFVDDGAVILDTRSSGYYSLDVVAAEIWERLGKGESLEQAVAALVRRYGEPAARVEADAREFLRELLAERLLEPV